MGRKVIPEDTGFGTDLFVEEFTGRFFMTSKEALLEAEKRVNELFQIRGYAYLNDFYRYLHLPETQMGSVMGWSCNPDWELGVQEIEFDHILTDLGMTCVCSDVGYALRYLIGPHVGHFR